MANRGLFLSVFSAAVSAVLTSACTTSVASDAPTASADPAPGQLCVQTFNAYGPAYAKDVSIRTNRLVDLIRKETPACDLLQLQEVWNDGHLEMLEKGLSDTGARIFPARRIASKNEKVGLVTLVPPGLQPSANQYLRLYEVNNQGGLIDGIRKALKVEKGFHRIELLDPSGETIQAVNTHTHPTDEAIRLAQVLEFVEWSWGGLDYTRPILLTGDFNATPDSLEVRILTGLVGLSDSYREIRGRYLDGECTICRKNPIGWTTDDRVVDYVFWRSGVNLSLQPVQSEMNWVEAEGEPLSDHKGVRTLFETYRKPSVPAAAANADDAISLLEEAERVLKAEEKDYLQGALERVKRMKETFRKY